ncbi:hypothetical protein C2845_PM10G02300 [Panicum miliaceum]|uniref:Uncharacterized protein n=1 Tax=Panicum miliaceum TaxID=4540 RepID=A0A3L6PDA1_PANMI|nr:hypothetical protein C2845_PM10G02300 [Panicum miliaceum]
MPASGSTQALAPPTAHRGGGGGGEPAEHPHCLHLLERTAAAAPGGGGQAADAAAGERDGGPEPVARAPRAGRRRHRGRPPPPPPPSPSLRAEHRCAREQAHRAAGSSLEGCGFDIDGRRFDCEAMGLSLEASPSDAPAVHCPLHTTGTTMPRKPGAAAMSAFVDVRKGLCRGKSSELLRRVTTTRAVGTSGTLLCLPELSAGAELS